MLVTILSIVIVLLLVISGLSTIISTGTDKHVPQDSSMVRVGVVHRHRGSTNMSFTSGITDLRAISHKVYRYFTNLNSNNHHGTAELKLRKWSKRNTSLLSTFQKPYMNPSPIR